MSATSQAVLEPKTKKTKKTKRGKKHPFNHKILSIDDNVKKLVTAYIGLFDNQKEAADKIGVSACTINTYNTRSTNIALYVFNKIIKELLKVYTLDELNSELGDETIESIKEKASKQNGAQIDNVMYLINDKIRYLMDLYVAPFPSREAAGAHLGLNPRTFTAYFKGQIASFPRRYFWKMVKELNAQGYTTDQLLNALEVDSMQEFLISKQRSYTLKLDKKELRKELIRYFEKGTLRERDISRSIVNASERLYGNLGTAIRAAMKDLTKRTVRIAQKHMYKGDYMGALDTLNQLQDYIRLYQKKEIQINKSLPKEKKRDLTRLMRPFYRASQELQDEISDFIDKFALTVYRQEADTLNVDSPDDNPNYFRLIKKYNLYQSFELGDIIEHPGLGVGEIIEIKNHSRMKVQFYNKKHGCKELVMNVS